MFAQQGHLRKPGGGLRRFTHGLRMVYATVRKPEKRFTQGLRGFTPVYAVYAQGNLLMPSGRQPSARHSKTKRTATIREAKAMESIEKKLLSQDCQYMSFMTLCVGEALPFGAKHFKSTVKIQCNFKYKVSDHIK